MNRISFIIIVTLAYGCSKKPAEKPDLFEYESGKKLALVEDERLGEASGIAVSVNNKGMLWTHNDSGNPAEVYLIDRDAKIRLTVALQGVENRDWEDIAVGPGPDDTSSYVYVADIGDNNAKYPLKIVYRFVEPVLSDFRDDDRLVISDFETIVFRLEDGAKDSETLIVHPLTRDMYIVSKREQPVVVYEVPYSQLTTDTVTVHAIGRIPLTQIAGGDISSDGRELLLKNYQNVFYWSIGENEKFEDAIKKPARILPYVEEPQGEAIAFSRDGSGYYTISEKIIGEKSFLKFYPRK